MNILCKWLGLVLMLTSFNAMAHEGHDHQKSDLAISVTFDSQGQLWRALVKNGIVQVDYSADLGSTFSQPVKVNTAPQKIAADGEARPKIVVADDGNIYVTWTEELARPFTGYIWFSRSINNGKSFEAPYIVHQDRAEITHRFDAINVTPRGRITVAWVDKRDLIADKAANKHYNGAAIYYAVSQNNGVSFDREKKLADSSCECCRITLVSKADGTVAALWRHVFAGSERDHAIAELAVNGTEVVHRATYGHWKIDGCPHQGAALAVGEGFGYHMAWFDGSNEEAGGKATLYVARMDGDAWVSSVPKKFGNNAHQAAHPALLSQGENVWLAWSEINPDSKMTEILGKTSTDGGRNWENAQLLLITAGAADYPILLMHKGVSQNIRGEQPYLAVNTVADGLKVILLK